jgi:hypothetical protein
MTDVNPDMTIIATTDNTHPLRLLWLFARSVAVAGIVASAVYAAIYVAEDMRRTRDVPPAAPATNIDVPSGFEVLTPLANARAFQQVVGFAPVVPKTLPAGTTAGARFDATAPDATGARSGELRFAAQRGADGTPLGPSLLLAESHATGNEGATAAALVDDGTYAASIPCGAIRIDARIYFAASVPATGAAATAQSFVDALTRQCGR